MSSKTGGRDLLIERAPHRVTTGDRAHRCRPGNRRRSAVSFGHLLEGGERDSDGNQHQTEGRSRRLPCGEP